MGACVSFGFNESGVLDSDSPPPIHIPGELYDNIDQLQKVFSGKVY